MTIKELKWALMRESPVVYQGITYEKVTAVIYRKTKDGKRLCIQGELLDRTGRAVTIAAMERIEVK